MSDSLLRSRLIRLASENPALRKDLLPLLKEAGVFEDNPYSLYPGHEAVTAQIQEEIAMTAVSVASSYQAILRLIDRNEDLGSKDTESRGLILDDWNQSIKKAMVGRT